MYYSAGNKGLKKTTHNSDTSKKETEEHRTSINHPFS
jgi:hypothetical protein